MLLAGRLDSQLDTASNAFLRAKLVPPDPALVQAMWAALGRAHSICAQCLRANPRDAEARYALGLTYAVEADYDFNVARRYWDALHAGSKAKQQHELARDFDPSNHDANLLIGTYEYAVGSVPTALCWLLYLAGYSASKERGVELLQDAMLRGKEISPAALTLLAVIYNRETMYAYARQMLQHLLRFFSRNDLVEMEIGGSYLREGQLDAAIATYQDVARKMETRAPGFDRVDAPRLYFQIASPFEQQNRASEALGYYQRVVRQKEKEGILTAERLPAHGRYLPGAAAAGEGARDVRTGTQSSLPRNPATRCRAPRSTPRRTRLALVARGSSRHSKVLNRSVPTAECAGRSGGRLQRVRRPGLQRPHLQSQFRWT